MLLPAGVTILCMTVLWLPMFSEADDYVSMTLTSQSSTYIYRFSDNLFKKLYECLCEDNKICYAEFDYSRYDPRGTYRVSSVTQTSAIKTQQQVNRCRYYVCKPRYYKIRCDVYLSESSLASTTLFQSVNYTRSSECSNMCTTFVWSNINDTITSYTSNLLSVCDNSCRSQTSTATTVRTSTNPTVRTSTDTTRTTIRSTASTTKTIYTYITTQKSSVSLTSTQISNDTLTVNFTSPAKQMKENSSIIIVAVIVPILIAIIVGVVLVAFLWRRRQLSKQDLLRQNSHGSPVVLPSSSSNKEPGNTYLSLNSQRKSAKNQQSEENTSSYDYVDFNDNDKSGCMNTLAGNNKFKTQSNSSKGEYSNADYFPSSLQSSHLHNSTTNKDLKDKRIVYFPDRNSRDESDDAHQSIYSLATCDLSADVELNATEIQQLKKKQAMNTRPRENENSKTTVAILKQEYSSDYGSPYMDIDNTNNGYKNMVEGSLVTNDVSKEKINPILSVPTIDEIYVDDKRPTINSSGSGNYNNIVLKRDNATQIHLDVQQDDTKNEEESASYYYSSNAGIIQNIVKERSPKKDVTEKSFRTQTSSVDKGNNPTSDADTEYSVANISNHDQMSATNHHVYSKLRDEEVHIIHPYNTLQLQNE